MTREEIQAGFEDGWRVDAIDATAMDITIGPKGARAWRAMITRL